MSERADLTHPAYPARSVVQEQPRLKTTGTHSQPTQQQLRKTLPSVVTNHIGIHRSFSSQRPHDLPDCQERGTGRAMALSLSVAQTSTVAKGNAREGAGRATPEPWVWILSEEGAFGGGGETCSF